MYNNNNLIIALTIIIPSIIVSIALLLSSNNKYSVRILPSFYLLQISILTMSSLILSSYKYVNLFPYGHIGNLFTYCLAPTMYLYIKKHLSLDKKIRLLDFVHYIPFIVILIYFIYQTVFNDLFYGKHTDQFKYKALESLQSVTYFVLIIKYIKHSAGSVINFLFKEKNKKNEWLKFLLFSSIIVWAIKLYTFLALERWGNIGLYFSGLSIYMITALILVTGTVFFILNRPKLLIINSKIEKDPVIKNRIEEALLEDDRYRDIEMSFKKLASCLNMSEKDLSKSINDNFNMNYYQLLNSLRIKKCIEIMSNPDNENYSIADFQYEVGFASKSSFFTNFKSYTGQTPLKYKKKLKNCG